MAGLFTVRMRILLVAGLALLVITCQVIPTPPTLSITPTRSGVSPEENTPAPPSDALSTPSPGPTPSIQNTPPDLTGGLPPFPSPLDGGFSEIRAATWEANPYKGQALELPFPLKDAANYQVTEGLTLSQRDFLETNGFVVLKGQEVNFSDMRMQVALRHGQPYYLSSDAAYHALSTNLNELVSALEREELHPRMLDITQAAYQELLNYLPLVKDTPIEADALVATAYMGVALRLLDPQTELDPDIAPLVTAQVVQIQAAQGQEASTLIPAFQDDYRAYQPKGHYAGDPQLEAYFRGMTWFARFDFPISGLGPESPPSRAPLLITLALRKAKTPEGETAAQAWQRLNEVLTFMGGGTQHDGPSEYAALMDQVFGPRVTLISLADEPLWQSFQTLAGELPASVGQTSFSIFLEQAGSVGSGAQRGWRFMGPRFNPETFFFENLVYDRVGDSENRRELPSGLDVMAVLGSPFAEGALKERGDISFQNYLEQLDSLKEIAAAQQPGEWLSSAQGAWMYALSSQLTADDSPYPAYMQSPVWGYRALDGALGGWVKWRHDAVLRPVPPPEALLMERPTSSAPPCYVEPQPQVYYRLAYLAGALIDGLERRGMLGKSSSPLSLSELANDMLDLADRLGRIGDIAAKELEGISLEEGDCALAVTPLGAIETRYFQSQLLSAQDSEAAENGTLDTYPVPFISNIAQASERILQAGVGKLNRIYVLVPLDGQVYIAQGGVFSYYEFVQPIEDELNSETWRQALSPDWPPAPFWANNYLLPGGTSIDVLAFRVGDVYRLTLAGSQLGLRAVPSRSARYIHRPQPGDVLAIVDGPTPAEGFTWWKFQTITEDGQSLEGWATVTEDWFERAWGQ
jgi:hypothetical protein